MRRRKLYDEAKLAMDEHRWLESERAGADLGHDADETWARRHWVAFFRERFVRHLKGDDFYEELGDESFGALEAPLEVEPTLLAQVVQKIRDGAENLDIFRWSSRERLPKDAIVRILKAVDLNGRRLPPPRGMMQSV